MASLRSEFWARVISKEIGKAPEIKDTSDIRKDFSGDSRILRANYWKKDKEIDYSNFNIEDLPVLKLENKKIKSNKTLLYLHGGG